MQYFIVLQLLRL